LLGDESTTQLGVQLLELGKCFGDWVCRCFHVNSLA
jgi:hypothetical protein